MPALCALGVRRSGEPQAPFGISKGAELEAQPQGMS